jgi:thiol-disulfide isomerase/thioredoxin
MKSFILIITLVLLYLPAGSLAGYQGPALRPIADVKLRDLDGKDLSSGALKGNILVLDFWATWCGPCISEIPAFNQLQGKFNGKGVKVIGITLASGAPGEVKPFVARHKMEYTVLLGDDDQAADYNIMAFPTTYVVGRDGAIFSRYVGASAGKVRKIESDIQQLLARGEQ